MRSVGVKAYTPPIFIMTTTDIINRVLDTINRPSDNAVWLSRATTAVNSALAKLYKKINFTIFKTNTQITADHNGYIDLSGFTNVESVYDVTQEAPALIKTENACRFSQLNQKTYPNIVTVPYSEQPTVYKNGLTLHGAPDHIYDIIGTVPLVQATDYPDKYSDFLENVVDYVYYEALISMFILLNEDADRITTAKAFRDEAFLDIMTWNNSYDDLGMRNIEG